MDKLLKCPFCGGEAEREIHGKKVTCGNYNCTLRLKWFTVKEWNSRVQPDVKVPGKRPKTTSTKGLCNEAFNEAIDKVIELNKEGL